LFLFYFAEQLNLVPPNAQENSRVFLAVALAYFISFKLFPSPDAGPPPPFPPPASLLFSCFPHSHRSPPTLVFPHRASFFSHPPPHSFFKHFGGETLSRFEQHKLCICRRRGFAPLLFQFALHKGSFHGAVAPPQPVRMVIAPPLPTNLSVPGLHNCRKLSHSSPDLTASPNPPFSFLEEFLFSLSSVIRQGPLFFFFFFLIFSALMSFCTCRDFLLLVSPFSGGILSELLVPFVCAHIGITSPRINTCLSYRMVGFVVHPGVVSFR